MLTEKSELINDILAKKLKMEKDIKANVEMQLVAHITDIFKELKEQQSPYAFTHKYTEALEKTVKDHTQSSLRKHYRSSLDEEELLWKSIIEAEKTNKSTVTIAIEANAVFSDVDSTYESLKECLFPSVSKILSIPGFDLSLTDLVEYI